ncbi:MAG: hypothetical protein GXY83_20490 [Rhodopirellula sp.]|nr:hypothetical protein [Rhodopirellula sp.]
MEVKDVLVEEMLRSVPAGTATARLDIGKCEVYAAISAYSNSRSPGQSDG